MPFSLQDTLESGQVFRWEYTDGGARVCHANTLFTLNKDGTSPDARPDWLAHFLREDQPRLAHKHPHVHAAIEQTRGIRVLRQDPWECLVTFIPSQNNNTKRIAQNVRAIAQTSGKKLRHGFYAFPKPGQLPDEQELRALGLGYRAPYIAALRTIDRDWLYGLTEKPYAQAKKALQTLAGVGPKVADCVLLFSLGHDQACPEDVWIKKVFSQHDLTREDLGPNAGLIQQALFHHARTQ